MIETFTVEVVVEAPESHIDDTKRYIERRLGGSLQFLHDNTAVALLFRDQAGHKIDQQIIRGNPSEDMLDVIDELRSA